MLKIIFFVFISSLISNEFYAQASEKWPFIDSSEIGSYIPNYECEKWGWKSYFQKESIVSSFDSVGFFSKMRIDDTTFYVAPVINKGRPNLYVHNEGIILSKRLIPVFEDTYQFNENSISTQNSLVLVKNRKGQFGVYSFYSRKLITKKFFDYYNRKCYSNGLIILFNRDREGYYIPDQKTSSIPLSKYRNILNYRLNQNHYNILIVLEDSQGKLEKLEGRQFKDFTKTDSIIYNKFDENDKINNNENSVFIMRCVNTKFLDVNLLSIIPNDSTVVLIDTDSYYGAYATNFKSGIRVKRTGLVFEFTDENESLIYRGKVDRITHVCCSQIFMIHYGDKKGILDLIDKNFDHIPLKYKDLKFVRTLPLSPVISGVIFSATSNGVSFYIDEKGREYFSNKRLP